ncbi:MAG TPA: FecR domain-containing protein [Rhizomicrobium sp.]|nr:FecR domain-containing protein [Rhizomicrobium sp.]
MSGPFFPAENAPATPIEHQAAQFIEKRDCAIWTDADQAELEEWISSSPAHRVAYLRLDASWKRAERLAALRSPGRSWRERLVLPVAGKIAAALVLAIAAGAGTAYYVSLPQFSAYSTKLGERETLTLRDGTRIELNTDTLVQISDDQDRRHVRLERGEAYFDVVHDAAHPFTVSVGAAKVTDIGTKFVVRREPDRFSITMLQGAARFDGSENGTNRSLMLRAGDAMIASAGGISLIKKPHAETARETSWRQGVLVFDETPLSEAAAEFNRYNRVKIIVTDPVAAKVGIGGTFATANVYGFARVAQGLLGLHVENHGDRIVVTR